MERKAHDIDSCIRRLKQIGEHEIAEMMARMYITLRGFGCSACEHMHESLAEEPCASCVRFSNWKWRGD